MIPKAHLCDHCSREIINAGSLAAHQQSCKQNPNHRAHAHSPTAGRKKGSMSPTRGMKLGRPAHWDERFSFAQVLVENSTYSRTCLRRRILEHGMLSYTCTICGLPPIWLNKPMPLILDHINGINNDHRLENLRFVCSNCDTQLPTYKSKNR